MLYIVHQPAVRKSKAKLETLSFQSTICSETMASCYYRFYLYISIITKYYIVKICHNEHLPHIAV